MTIPMVTFGNKFTNVFMTTNCKQDYAFSDVFFLPGRGLVSDWYLKFLIPFATEKPRKPDLRSKTQPLSGEGAFEFLW